MPGATDNVVADPGAGGETFASDSIGSVHFQRVKVNHGVDGSATDVSSASPMPVDTELTTVDADTGAGTDTRAGVVLVRAESGGGVLVGSGNPLPVSGTVTANAGSGTFTVDTELDAAAAAADAAANPTTAHIGAFLSCFNGTTWDRARGDTANGIDVDVTRVGGTVTVTGTVTANAGSGTMTVDTELAAAAALADATVNPTIPSVGSLGLLYNGTTWDRVRGDTTNGLDVDVTRLPSLPAGTNNIGDVDVLTVPAPLSTTGGGTEATALRVTVANDSTGVVSVDDNGGSLTVDGTITANLAAGTNNIGDVDVLSIAAGTNAIGNVGIIPRTSGGATTFHLVSAATTNATNIKASAGQVFGWYIYNSNAAARKVAFHNASGTPTAGSSVYFSLMIPATSAANVFYETGIAFGTGIAITTVTGLADSDSAAVAANDLIINIWYA